MAQQTSPELQGSTATVRERLRGKWQIPLLILSVGCFALAVIILVTHPPQEKISPESLLEQADAALASGRYELADERATRFVQEYPSHASVGRIHEIQGDANFQRSLTARESERDLLKKAEAGYRQANALRPGGIASPGILLKLGRTHQRMGEQKLAINCYNEALESAPEDPLPIHMAKIEALRAGKPDLDAALAEVAVVRKPLLAEEKTKRDELAAAEREAEEGEAAARQKAASLKSQLAHIEGTKRKVALVEAEVLNELGRHQEAEEKLLAVLSAETASDESKKFLLALADTQRRAGQFTRSLDTLDRALGLLAPTALRSRAGDALDAQAFLMQGRVFYEMTNYDKALHWFERTAREYPDSDEAVAARLGTAETYLALGEVASASQAYAAVAPALLKLRPGENRWIDLNAARQALKVQGEACVLRRQFDDALGFVMLEESILQTPDRDVLLRKAAILRQVAEVAAAEAADRALAAEERGLRRLKAERAWNEAGGLFLRVAETFDARTQKEYPDDVWEATRCYLLAGMHERSAEVLARFIREQPRDARVPQARLDLGRQYEVLGRWNDAIKTLRDLVDESGTTLAGYEGLYLLGKSFIRNGPDFYDHAEQAFLTLVEGSPDIEPESIWYQRSLLELGRLLHRRGNYDPAIIRLSEYLQRYPGDPDALAASYLVASSIRQQGLRALAQSAQAVRPADKEAFREVHRQKLQSAVKEFRRLAPLYDALPQDSMSALRMEEHRGVLFGLADSLYELGELDEAVKVYNVIVHRFQSFPCAMSAYVQLGAAYEAMGRRDQAAAALERARWTLEKIPAEAFDRRIGEPTKQYWENWFRTLQR